MRGSPLTQAILLLIGLLTIGYVGNQFMTTAPSAKLQHDKEAKESSNPHDSSGTEIMIDAEFELTFSTPPHSYKITRLSPEDEREITVYESTESEDNPSYADTTIPSHQLDTYWIDIVWNDEPEPSKRHFVQIKISPNQGAFKQLSFFSSSATMNETFEYNTEGESSQ